MTREERILMAIDKGITCNPITGEIKGIRGKIINAKSSDGYIHLKIYIDKNGFPIRGHQFIWYCVHGKVVDEIDHINGIRDDNRIENLRSVTRQENQWNRKNSKGYSWNKLRNKWQSCIKVDGKSKHIGYFENEEEAHQSYLDAKKIYHKKD